MKNETCLLTSFIKNKKIISCCDFLPDQISNGFVVYEVIRVIDGVPLFLDEHITRFFYSIKNSNRNTTFSRAHVLSSVITLIDVNKLADGNIKFQINFVDGKIDEFAAWICPFFYPNAELYIKGIELKSQFIQRKNPNNKVLNKELVEQAASIIKDNNVFELLLVNKNGNVTEGSKSNIFFVSNNGVFTPKTDAVLPGITRSKVIEALQKINIPCLETDISLSSICNFQGAFITGTSPKVLPINQIDNVKFNPSHSIIKELISEFNTMVNNDIISFSERK